MTVDFLRGRGALRRPILVLLALFPFALGAEAAFAVTRSAFLSALLNARGLDWSSAREARKKDGAAFMLRSGLVTESVGKLSAPATRREALRWSIQALGLESEARILSGLPLPFKDAPSLSAFERGCQLPDRKSVV